MHITADEISAVAAVIADALPDLIKKALESRTEAPPAMAESDTRTHVTTEEAARMLGRQPQTLRGWASSDSGLLRPVRAGARLMWSVAEIKALLSAPKGPKARAAA